MNGDDRTIIQDPRVESSLLAAKPDVASVEHMYSVTLYISFT
jgi:hypothetical protein